METKALIFRTWDDLVFATRNKAYGAYAIRRAYSRRVVMGLGVSVAAVVLFLFAPGLASRIEKKGAGTLVTPEPFIVKLYEYVPPVRERKPPQQQPASQTLRTNTEVVVVSNTEEVTEQTEAVTSTGISETTGEDIGEIFEGTGLQVSELPLIAENQRMANPEVMPSYEGGIEEMMRFIKRKLRYPPTPRRMGIEGTVFVSFVVNGDGSVSEVNVLRGIHMACDEEAVRVISMLPGWNGGKQNGIPVSVRMVLPIKFSLQNQ